MKGKGRKGALKKGAKLRSLFIMNSLEEKKLVIFIRNTH
jgi:hypothetical protein